jgi:hypothetical protein
MSAKLTRVHNFRAREMHLTFSQSIGFPHSLISNISEGAAGEYSHSLPLTNRLALACARPFVDVK